MTSEKYVKQIVKHIQCNKKKKQDIARQLMAEIEERNSQGEPIDKIISDMGNTQEVAESFNENILPEEIKIYKRTKFLCIFVPIILCFIVIGFTGYWILPKTKNIESSKFFTNQEIEKQVANVIDLLDHDDYTALKELSTPSLSTLFDTNAVQNAKKQINNDFGKRIIFGTIYSREITQQGKSFALAQVNVSYSNVAVTYTITFDKDMKLAGLYMK